MIQMDSNSGSIHFKVPVGKITPEVAKRSIEELTKADLEDFHKKPKSQLEEIVGMITAQERIEMIQQGLNPFNVEDISYFRTIQNKTVKLSFWSRFKAAWSFAFKNKINDDLEIAVLKKINNSKSSPSEPVLPNHSIVSELLKNYKNYEKVNTEVLNNLKKRDMAKFTETVLKAPPSGIPRRSEKFQTEILENLKKREEDSKIVKETPKMEIPKEAFIPGKIPTVFEEAKPVSKRVKIKMKLADAKVVAHRGQGKKVKPVVKKVPAAKRVIKGKKKKVTK